MPKANSAAKQARSSQRKRLRNQAVKSRIRSGLKRLEQLLKGDMAVAKVHARQVVSWLDRAAKTKIMHVNATRRYKSRVMACLTPAKSK